MYSGERSVPLWALVETSHVGYGWWGGTLLIFGHGVIDQGQLCPPASGCHALRCLVHFCIRKKGPILCLRIPVLQSKQVIFIRSTPAYLRWFADQTRSKYDEPTLYRRPPRCTIAQHTTCGERDHPRPFLTGWKTYPAHQDLSERTRSTPLYVRQIYALPHQGQLIADPSIFPEQERARVDRLSSVNGALS